MIRKKAILFIHGFAGGIYDYGNLINDLELTGKFDVFSYTLPKHNELVINNVTNKDWIRESEYQIEKLINNNYKEIFVIGHSMGGVIATHLASKYKEIKKLVLGAPAFKFFEFRNNKINFIDSIKLIPNVLKNYTIREILAKYFKVPLHTVKEFSYLVNEYYDDVKNVYCPTLILHGSDDITVPIESINYVYNNIGSNSVKMIQVENVNHSIFCNDRYDDIKCIIIDFLEERKNNIKEKYFI